MSIFDSLSGATSAVSTITKVLSTIKSVVDIGRDAGPMIKTALDTFRKKDLTEDDLKQLESRIDKLRAELHAPLPEPEEGEGT
jgi:hypothetical protein